MLLRCVALNKMMNDEVRIANFNWPLATRNFPLGLGRSLVLRKAQRILAFLVLKPTQNPVCSAPLRTPNSSERSERNCKPWSSRTPHAEHSCQFVKFVVSFSVCSVCSVVKSHTGRAFLSILRILWFLKSLQSCA